MFRRTLLLVGLIMIFISCTCAPASAHYQIEWETIGTGGDDNALLSNYNDHNGTSGISMKLYEDGDTPTMVFMKQYVSLMDSFEMTFKIP
jgi:hypothetical protein